MTNTEKKTPFKTAVSNLEFHNFEESPEFTGLYRETVEIGEEEKFTAHIFVDVETGEKKYVGNAYSIEKAIKTAKAEYKENFAEIVFNFKFLGKTTVKGKPFNQFEIGYCTLSEYEAFEGK